MQDLVREVRAIERRGGSADDYIEGQPRELRSGLVITIDGGADGLVDVPVEQPQSTARAMVVELRVEAPLDPAVPHTVRISNGNRPEVPTYFCTSATVARAWLVDSTTLVGDKDWNGQWRMDEGGRELEVRLRPRGGLGQLALWLGPDRHGARPVDQTGQDGGFAELSRGWLPFLIAAAGVGGALIWRLRARER